MISSLPRLRADLVVSQQLTAGGVVFVLKDPIRNQFYRLLEEAHFIARQLDGETQLDVVRRRTEEKFRTPLPAEQLSAFVGSLDTAGLLATGKSGDGRSRLRRVQGNILNLRFRFFDPDRLFNRLVDKVQFLFTPHFLVFSATIILAAACVAFANWDEAVQNLSRLFRFSALPVILLVVFLVITAHEFAHGLTCKHFGGEVHELGFLLIYFQPALYCNVSDAWLFPEKSKRLWVGFAGPYFELFLWALATLLWRLTDVETGINYLAFIVMTTSGIKTLFNFNPVIKLDGYYLLSDWLEIPNLRKKGFACLGDGIKRLFGARVTHMEQIPPRERRICLTYGLVAGVGSLWLLCYALGKFGSAFLQSTQPAVLALSAWFLGLKLRRRARRLFGKSSGSPVDLDDPDSFDTPNRTEMRQSPAPLEQSGPKEGVFAEPAGTSDTRDVADSPSPEESPKATRPRRKRRMFRASKRYLKLAAIAGLAAVALVCFHAELKIKGPFVALPVRNADVRAGAEGIVEETCVREGQTVQQGDLIARLFDRDVRADLQKTAAGIEEAQAKLRLLTAGPRAEEIEQARIEVAKLTEAIKFATSRMERERELYAGKLVSRQELEDSEAILAERKSELATAKSRLDVLLAGTRREEIEAMQAAVTSLETQRHYLRLMRILSPASGIVATPARQLMEMKHQFVKKGDLIAKVHDLKTITAELVVSERDIADVNVGQKVVLKVRAYPEKTFYGQVTSIATVAQANSSSTASALAQAPGGAPTTSGRSAVAPKTITITTEIDNSSLFLKPEMTGQAKILCGERRLLDILLRRIARTVKVEFWSWW
jgi:multidrug resistance efflux pump